MQDQRANEFIQLGRFLDRCREFDDDIDRLLHDGWNLSSRRHVVTMAFSRASLGHAISQRLLIGSEQHGTALALVRLHFETTVRAAWALLGATDEWLDKFSTPVAEGDLKEPAKGPTIPDMLKDIESKAPDIAREGRRAYETVKVMHSFVHGGVHLVVHALRGYPPDKLIDVLRNRNMLMLMLCNVIVVGSERLALLGSVGRLSGAYADVMPPVAVNPGE